MSRITRKQHKDEFEKEARQRFIAYCEDPSIYSTLDQERFPDAFYYEDIKPIFYGYEIKLALLPALKDANLPGLAEAIEYATQKLIFAGEELRRCNIKNNFLIKSDKKYDCFFDEHNFYKPGNLQFCTLYYNKSFEGLSDETKKWFNVYEHSDSQHKWKDIVPNIPYAYCKEIKVPIYITKRKILNSEYLQAVAYRHDKFLGNGYFYKAEHALGIAQYSWRWRGDITKRNYNKVISKEIAEGIEEIL